MNKKVTPFFIFIVLVSFNITSLAQVDLSGVSPSEVLSVYVGTEDSNFNWRIYKEGKIKRLKIFKRSDYIEGILTSQEWKGELWRHWFCIVIPKGMSLDISHALLVIDGGSWKDRYDTALTRKDKKKFKRYIKQATLLAKKLRTPVVMVKQVPFQPIDERKEDALIAFTFDKFLETGDSSWLLLLPMVKVASQVMTASQEIMRDKWSLDIETFTSIGASKRGWTTWLIPKVDDRVTIIIPMAFDAVNLAEQLHNQIDMWGSYSSEISDYTDRGYPGKFLSERGKDLLMAVDPYSYFSETTKISRFIMLTTNDSYSVIDGARLYFPDLSEPKYLSYIPNQGHRITSRVRFLKKIVGNINMIHSHAAFGTPLPKQQWNFNEVDGKLSLTIRTDSDVTKVLIWIAYSEKGERDFRGPKQRSHRIKSVGDNVYTYTVEIPEDRCLSLYADVMYKKSDERGRYSLSTEIAVAGPENLCSSFVQFTKRISQEEDPVISLRE